ncbi:T9SS type A sorting domain-containing protein [bacterium]|nr:T9SS type A sorting domain-containing protein [bacterium]
MKTSYFKGILYVIGFLLIGSGGAVCQEVVGSQEIRWLRVGDLHAWVSNAGAEVEFGRRGRASFEGTDQTDNMYWEALYSNSDRNVSRGMWLGTANYNDPVSGETYACKVVQAGPRFANLLTNFMPVTFKMIGRYEAPAVLVDGMIASDNYLNDVLDEVDPDMPADRMVLNVMHTNLGVTVKRKVMAFSQGNHDDYIICEYILKNTGIINLEGSVSTQSLDDVYFMILFRYAPAWEATRFADWAPAANIGWGRNTVYDVFGEDPDASDFEMRGFYAYYGPHSSSPGYESDWGCPRWDRSSVLGAPAFIGAVTLHADTGPDDQSDDPSQPGSTPFLGADAAMMSAIDSYYPSMMSQQYEAMMYGHESQDHAAQVGDEFADRYGVDPGGYIQCLGYGPYDLIPGDSVRIIIAEGVHGLTRRKSLEVGTRWYAYESGTGMPELIMPDGSSTSDHDQYKKAWVWTAEDSILQTYRRAMDNYQSGYNIPQPVPPPETFEVRSGSDKITLSWADNATSYPHFGGYRIYRAIGSVDTFYTLIFQCSSSDVVHEYTDRAVISGVNYYYYIQTIDDGTNDNMNTGMPFTLASSKFWTLINTPAFLRPSLTVYPGDTDNNGVVDALDVLPIGLYFMETVIQRDALSFEWKANNHISLNQEKIGPTYADANGDGTVDEKDVIGIGVNWGNTHSDITPIPLSMDIEEAKNPEHREAFRKIYNCLQGNSEAVQAMKTLLEGLLGETLPQACRLEQNFPNPFNPETAIRFALPEPQSVSLMLYNMRGQSVKALISNQPFAAGVHTVRLRSGDLESGIYLYRIQTDTWSAFRKLIVVK